MTAELAFDRPIIVLGAPRSGTTLLGRVLAAHPSSTLLVEPRFTWRYGNDRKSDSLTPSDARPEVRAYIRSQFACRVEADGGTRLVEKSPANSVRPEFVEAVFPEARFVHIIRNGISASISAARMWKQSASGIRNLSPNRKAAGQATRLQERRNELGLRRTLLYAPEVLRRVAPSWMHSLTGPPLWGPRLPGLARLVRTMPLVEVTGLQWQACVETSCEFGRRLPPERYCELRLEDLNEEILGEVLAFCELDDHPEPFEQFRREFVTERATGRRPWDGDDQAIAGLLERIGPTLESLGYSSSAG